MEIALDANNNIVGWRHRFVNESYFARIMPPDLFAKIKKDIVSGGGGGDMTYAVPNHLVRVGARSARSRRWCLARDRGGLHQIRD